MIVLIRTTIGNSGLRCEFGRLGVRIDITQIRKLDRRQHDKTKKKRQGERDADRQIIQQLWPEVTDGGNIMMVPRKRKGQNENSRYSSPGSKIKTSSTIMDEEMRAATSRFCRKCSCVGYTLKRDWTHAHDRKAREEGKRRKRLTL